MLESLKTLSFNRIFNCGVEVESDIWTLSKSTIVVVKDENNEDFTDYHMYRYSPDNWAMSICTVDGQRFSLGNVNTMFTMQSCSKVP